MGKVIGEAMVVQKKDKGKIQTDPFGSYTGRPRDPDEMPIQDADDL